jgi:hypothetical protein
VVHRHGLHAEGYAIACGIRDLALGNEHAVAAIRSSMADAGPLDGNAKDAGLARVARASN